MKILQKAVTFVLFFQSSGLGGVQSQEITGQASSGNFIIHEESSTNLASFGEISVSSNVPVTIQRYSEEEFLEGEQPVTGSDGKVLITSNCAATLFVPQVTWGSDSIEVTVQGAPANANIPYLQSSSYRAEWAYDNYWCRYMAQSETYEPAPTPTRLKGRNSNFSLKSVIPSSVTRLLQRVLRTNNERKMNEASDLLEASEECHVNVEVMIDGCSHSVGVSAPTVRVIDATIENTQSQNDPEDECIINMETDIMFTGEPVYGIKSLDVPMVDCMRAVPGRPFVDSTGKSLKASPLATVPTAAGGAGLWSAENTRPAESLYSSDNSTVNENQLLLGEEWTKNALGEHASVASFSAFSIALMTNHAPSNLVEDALKAALDEVRHAKTSFDIASTLTGKEVGPGPLPESTHAFGQDMKALAMAVAKEGCIDETLSALEIVAEVDLINAVLDGSVDGTKYSDIDRNILTWIRDELNIIALEESNHAALAWRTFEWVCSVDSDACNSVKEHVLSEAELERAFHRRFASFDGRSESLKIMEESWKKISSSHHDVESEICISNVAEGSTKDESLISVMAGNVIQGVSCGQFAS